MGLIKNSRGTTASQAGNYNYILELIKSGRLRAKNYSVGSKKAYWLVPESEIVRYHNTVTKINIGGDHGPDEDTTSQPQMET